MKRIFDLIVAFILSVALFPPLLLIALWVKMTSRGPVLYWSDRIGVNNRIFSMPKFRTMQCEAPVVATHLLGNPARYLTRIGWFLRKTSLDELPQLYSILRGHISFVGPRPALFNQGDLITFRTEKGVHRIIPGLTGWAQVNGRDDLSIPKKVEFDAYYLTHRSFLFDLRILGMTFLQVLRSKGITH